MLAILRPTNIFFGVNWNATDRVPLDADYRIEKSAGAIERQLKAGDRGGAIGLDQMQASKAIARSETNKLAIVRQNALAIARKKTGGEILSQKTEPV